MRALKQAGVAFLPGFFLFVFFGIYWLSLCSLPVLEGFLCVCLFSMDFIVQTASPSVFDNLLKLHLQNQYLIAKILSESLSSPSPPYLGEFLYYLLTLTGS